ncbi:hypothetical protein [Kaistella antarctica]|uniref:Uncharacterized protein n=2 Tax=Kaistella antarctica TaxID=266748 RepID=A0ABR4TX84_9FLAO|nr:hypothetical protein [Kaistella antarctica]KEY18305.1 hypothetical protein HY04_07235 [Kaistella antarctica]
MPITPNQSKQQRPSNNETIKTDKVMGNAHKILSSAINVLEEEIAAGILAAKKLEHQFINVEEVRDNQDQLMARIRRDTHEAVDIFLDAFAALTQQLNSVIDKRKTTSEETIVKKRASTNTNSSQTIVLENDKILKPGESAVFQIILSDDEKNTKIALIKSDFTSNDNYKISQRNISIKPSTLFLKLKEQAEITIEVKTLRTTVPGFYRAILSDKYNPKIIIILSFQIEN